MPIKILDRILKKNNLNSTKFGEYRGPGNPKYPYFKVGIDTIIHPPIDPRFESIFTCKTGKRETKTVLSDLQKEAENKGDWLSSGLLQLEIEKMNVETNVIPEPTPTPIPTPQEPTTLKERFLAFFKFTKPTKLPKPKELSDDELEDLHMKELELAGPYIKRHQALTDDGLTEKAGLLNKPSAIQKAEDEKREYQEKSEREEARCRKVVQDMMARRAEVERERQQLINTHGENSWEVYCFRRSSVEIKNVKLAAKKKGISPKRYILEERLKEAVADDLSGMGMLNLK